MFYRNSVVALAIALVASPVIAATPNMSQSSSKAKYTVPAPLFNSIDEYLGCIGGTSSERVSSSRAAAICEARARQAKNDPKMQKLLFAQPDR